MSILLSLLKNIQYEFATKCELPVDVIHYALAKREKAYTKGIFTRDYTIQR